MSATDGRNLQPRCSCSACTAGAGTPAGATGPTENWTVQQLMTQMINGRSWRGNGAGPVRVTYSFPTSVRDYGSDYAPGDESELGGFNPFTQAQQAVARNALAMWSDVANIELVEVQGTADIRFGNTTTEINFAHAYYPDAAYGGDVWVNSGYRPNGELGFGQYGHETLIHEIGHALGLNHANDYNLTTDQDNPTHNFDSHQYTLMSYYQHQDPDTGQLYPTAPMLMDILAIQQIYGANTNTRRGDTTYGFNATNDVRAAFDFTLNRQPLVAIWDGAGNDTLDLSGYRMDQRITLVAGDFSSVGGLTNNLAIAYGAEIENAIGGRGGDHITGNQLDNRLIGGGGSDLLEGGAGNDVLGGGNGRDQLSGGAGNDQLNGGRGRDELVGAAGDDTYVFRGRFGHDVVADFEGRNTLVFDGLRQNQVTLEQDGDNLVVSTTNGNRSVRVRDYFVHQDAYVLQFEDGTVGPDPVSPGGGDDDTLATATNLGTITPSTAGSLQDTVGGGDVRDVFRFDVTTRQQIRITLQGAQGDVDLFLYDGQGNLLAESTAGGTQVDWLQGHIDPGTYFIEVRPFDNVQTAYQLGVEGAPRTSNVARGQLQAAAGAADHAAAAAPESLALRDVTGLPTAAANDAGFAERRSAGLAEALLAA